MSASSSSVAECLQAVRDRISAVVARCSLPRTPRLVAVSKTHGAATLLEAYEAGQRHFGENYVQEVVDKAGALPADVRWHFIGHLQSNKVGRLVRGLGPSLAMVETVDRWKVAQALDRAWGALMEQQQQQRDREGGEKHAPCGPLPVLVQVNTSGEASKSGVWGQEAVLELCRRVASECPHLRLRGLMTIGERAQDTGRDFEALRVDAERVRDHLRELRLLQGKGEEEEEEEQGQEQEQEEGGGWELSMGMSGDFELAVEMGSTNVRVGSAIFGSRSYPPGKAQESKEGAGK